MSRWGVPATQRLLIKYPEITHMNIYPYLFMLPRAPNLIIWDYKNHNQFELNKTYATRFIELINEPTLFDDSKTIDLELLNAGILTSTPHQTPKWGWDDLSKIFHIGTKNIPFNNIPQNVSEWAAQYISHCTDVLSSPPTPNANPEYESCEPIHLPTSIHPTLPLTKSLISRKTCRVFTGEAVTIETVSTLLYLSLGYLREREDDRDESIAEGLHARRASPSSGGLNSCGGFLYVKKVTGLNPGIYAYHPALNAISFVNPLPDDPLGKLLCGQHFINNLPCGIFITSQFNKLWWKYGHSRAYRMAYIEVGHISQTFQLVATSLGLKTWLTGALTDDRVETLLKLDGSTEQPLFFVGCGRSDGQVMCAEMKALLGERGSK